MNVLTGIDSADSGNLIKPNDYRISYLKQAPEFPQNSTIMEAIFTGAAPVFQTIRDYEEALTEYGAHPDDKKLNNVTLKLKKK